MLTIDENGNRKWRNSKDKLHRLDGPAIEYRDGYKSWYKNGELHRLDGPAIEYANGYKVWYIDGVKYTEEEYKRRSLQ